MFEKKISIIIANYNNGHFFEDCYNSLINQTEIRWEAIIIDDSSTDNSVNIIKDLIKDSPQFKFYENEKNLGYQETLKKAIDLSNLKYFARLDPDDCLAPDAIEKCLKIHEKYPEVGLVYSNNIICDEKLNIIGKNVGKQVDNKIFYKGEIISFASFKKVIYKKTSGIDITNKRAEDKDIYLKMVEVAPVKYIDEDLYLYRIHNGGISSTSEKIDKAFFWYWVAIIKAGERTGINIENEFINTFIRRYEFNLKKNKLEKFKKNRWLKLGDKLGFIKIFKDL